MDKKPSIGVIGIASILIAMVMFIANRMYRTASRNGYDFFSVETFIQSWPYWVGAVIGGIFLLVWSLRSKRIKGDGGN